MLKTIMQEMTHQQLYTQLGMAMDQVKGVAQPGPLLLGAGLVVDLSRLEQAGMGF